MPYGMPGSIAKGQLLNELEIWLNVSAGGFENRGKLETQLGLSGNVIQAAKDAGFIFPGNSEDHLRRHLFGKSPPRPEPPEWWHEHQPIQSIVRYRLLKAIALSRIPANRNMYLYWVCGMETFEVVSCVPENQNHLTLLFLSPMPPVMGPTINFAQGAGAVEQIYITRADPGLREEAAQQGAGEGVITAQLKREV